MATFLKWKLLSYTELPAVAKCSQMKFKNRVHVSPNRHSVVEATDEVSLDSPERELILSSEPSPAITPVTPTSIITPRMETINISAPVIYDRSRDEVSVMHILRAYKVLRWP